MAQARGGQQGRERGSIDELPSGALRVRVYAGMDPVSKRRHYLTEVVPAGPVAATRARALRDRLVREVEDRRSPRTAATVEQLLGRYLDQLDTAPKTMELYRGYVGKHIVPLLGALKVSALDSETLDSFYAELRRCRDHCTGRLKTQHRMAAPHQCDARCGKHVCRPLGATTVRHMHFILSGAYKRAVRWKWVAVNPCSQAEPPRAPTPNPRPLSPSEAAQVVNAAWQDPDWGTLIWVAMTTGARRGELCGLRWSHVDLTAGREVLWLRRAISHSEHGWMEGDLKTHQQRRVALDPETSTVLSEHRERVVARAVALGLNLSKDAFVFSPEPDGNRFLAPSSLTQRYHRLAARLGIDTTFHKLRHYSVTELIAAGIDVRTVAGRLGHSGGGTTTLRAYAAWVSEADQRAAREIGGTMPQRPTGRDAIESARSQPRNPYERIAADIQEQIDAGSIGSGDPLPGLKELARTYSVAISTAQRAVALLNEWGLVEVRRGRRTVVLAPPSTDAGASVLNDGATAATDAKADDVASQLWSITLRGPDGHKYPARHVQADIDRPDSFRAHLLAIARIEVPAEPVTGDHWISDYELEVRPVGRAHSEAILTLRWSGS